MTTASDILFYIRTTLFCLVFLVLTLYSIPIIFVERFRIRYNVLTLNVCLGTMSCVLYFLVFAIMAKFNTKLLFRDNTCSFLHYMQMMCLCQGSYSIIIISINQFCDIVYYTNHFFETKRWLIICIASQWIAGLILSIPAYSRMQWYCTSSVWATYYKAFITIVVPVLVCVIIHVSIFHYIRSSTRRVQPRSHSTQTNNNTIPRPKISRRDAHLLRHMVFILSVFVIGWGFASFLAVVSSYIKVDENINTVSVLFAEISALSIVVDLFVYNHELRQYLQRKLRLCC